MGSSVPSVDLGGMVHLPSFARWSKQQVESFIIFLIPRKTYIDECLSFNKMHVYSKTLYTKS